MAVLVCRNAPAETRSRSPSSCSSYQSRPDRIDVGSPDVTSATPSETAWSRPTQPGTRSASSSSSQALSGSAPEPVTTVASSWPVRVEPRTTR